MDKLIDISSSPIQTVLKILLQDKTTKKNIIWATDTYEDLGKGFSDKEEITPWVLFQHADTVRPRIQKSLEAQQERTRKKAEVFTPAWLCNKMNNYCDEEWFDRKNVFNIENEDYTWMVVEESVIFPPQKKRKKRLWQRYVDSRRLEITCGEAPYLVSRYDVSTGERIYPLKNRIGQLDRKLRIVNENTSTYDEWLKWAIRAIESCYGYEYQGDNLLIARINFLLTFVDYYEARWAEKPPKALLSRVANKIAWNLWQMDGLKDTVPLGKPYRKYHQESLFDMNEESSEEREAIPCEIQDWRGHAYPLFKKLKETGTMKKLFDFVIGNPPYQMEQDSEDIASSRKNYAPPVYNIFMDAANDVSERTELIHPARFLFNAGSTPKKWNEKMLHDKHFKVLKYEPDSSKVFPGLTTPIKGGIAITYYGNKKTFDAIEVFNQYEEVNGIIHKVINFAGGG